MRGGSTRSVGVVALGCLMAGLASFSSFAADISMPAAPAIRANDNRTPGGQLVKNELHLSLETLWGKWYPDGAVGAPVPIQAFAERGKTPQIPGPLIRVPLNTVVVVQIHNAIAGTHLTVHGLQNRPAYVDRPLDVPFGQTRVVRFRAGTPGTFLYWASTTAAPLGRRFGADSQLSGAIVVEPLASATQKPADRIFVIGTWDNVTDKHGGPNFDYEVQVINGRSYPYTEQLTYALGERVHWRLVNSSFEGHPLHLHGFFFRVDSRGDGIADTIYQPGPNRDLRVTELMEPGHTFSMTWKAARAGNWLFHCHITYHVAGHWPIADMLNKTKHSDQDEDDFLRHAGMGGLILAVSVRGPKAQAASDPPVARRIGLLIEPGANNSPEAPSFKYLLNDGTQAVSESAAIGPAIVLNRGVSVAIDVTNHLNEPTTIHWHGIELQDGYYDGVGGFSGQGRRTAPMIDPGQTFEVRMVPPRAGTFIYHTHLNDVYQLRGGLAGPLIVLNPGERFDPTTDHIFTMTIPRRDADILKIFVNGVFQPDPLVVHAGVQQRLRFINITTFWTNAMMSLSSGNRVIQWNPIAVDGAGVAPARRRVQPAVDTITVGQTRDYTFIPTRGDLLLQIWPDPSVPAVSIPVHVI